MSFKEFDLSDYITALEEFKNNSTDDVVKHWGSIENFDMFIQKIRDNESEVAKLAIKQFGSIENYTESMKHNLEHFSELMDNWHSKVSEEMRTDDKFFKLASHKGEDVASDNVQNLVKEIIAYAHGNTLFETIGDDDKYCNMIIELYSNDYLKTVNDTEYGTGGCDYVAEAFQYYLHKSNQK